MKKIPKYTNPKSLKDTPTHYCAGCGHGIIHKLIARVIDDLQIRDKTIGIAPVGCAVLAYDYWDFDVSESAHGRCLAVATGIKRCLPDRLVFTYQGDGDLAAIGLTETLHAANRGENLTCIFINNACYGMTGGQMAPTTLLGQKTATTPWGRDSVLGEGWPLKVSEIISLFPGVSLVVREALISPQHVIRIEKAIKKAFINQMEKKGFSLIEILSPCPTAWQKDPYESMRWIEEEMTKIFPPGVLKER